MIVEVLAAGQGFSAAGQSVRQRVRDSIIIQKDIITHFGENHWTHQSQSPWHSPSPHATGLLQHSHKQTPVKSSLSAAAHALCFVGESKQCLAELCLWNNWLTWAVARPETQKRWHRL
jgi:hypothetical protein